MDTTSKDGLLDYDEWATSRRESGATCIRFAH